MRMGLRFKAMDSKAPPEPSSQYHPQIRCQNPEQGSVWDIPESGCSPALLLEGARAGLLEAPEGEAVVTCAHVGSRR